MTSLALPLRHSQFPNPSVARPATLMHARLLRENRVLDALPDSVWERIGPALSLVSLPAGKELQGSGVSLDAMYFPTDAVISLQYAMRNGDTAQVARIGCDGVLGVSLVMGGDAAPCRAVVQNPGHAFRLRADVLQQEFERGGAVTQLVMRCSQALCCQSAQLLIHQRQQLGCGDRIARFDGRKDASHAAHDGFFPATNSSRPRVAAIRNRTQPLGSFVGC